MSLQQIGFIELPAHTGKGGFDHAAVHQKTGRLYVAHTANDVYLHSIPDLKGVAGGLVSDEVNLVFTSNRGENTVGVFSPERDEQVTKMVLGCAQMG